MNRNDAIDLARAHALAHGQTDDNAYLPTTDAEAAEWLPHSWVVDAIVSAAAADHPRARFAEGEWTEVDLWAEIHRLRAAVKGPDGYASWQDAATAERLRRVKAEKALAPDQKRDAGGFQARYRLPGGEWSGWGHVVCGVKGHEMELREVSGDARRHIVCVCPDCAWPEKPPHDAKCECSEVGPDYCPRHTP